MKKIILAATGEELTWVPFRGGHKLCREKPGYGDFGIAYCYDGLTSVYTSDDLSFVRICRETVESLDVGEQKAVEAGVIRIEDDEPKPEPSRETYLIDEARAILIDVGRTGEMDYKRAFRWLADSEGV